jgi:hypothetical protein
MNLLFLSNPARGYYKFFNSLAIEFKREGHAVFIAVDCGYSASINRLNDVGVPVYIFSEYFSQHVTDKEILRKYSTHNLNVSLLPDFERAQANKTWGRRDIEYFDSLKSALLSFYTNILQEHKIDAIIFENVSDTFAYFAWHVCRQLNVAYCGVTTSRLPGRYTLTSDPLSESALIAGNMSRIHSGELKVPNEVSEWCARYIESIDKVVPDYMHFNGLDKVGFTSRSDNRDRFRVFFYALKHLMDDHYYAFKVGNPLVRRVQFFKMPLSRRFRVSRLDKYYTEADGDEQYLLYPLHVHPEASTSVLAPTYIDEYEVIRNIAFNLPEGVRLYVKDHVSAFGRPAIKFYESIARLPNVKLIRPFAATKELIRGSMAVITLTGTVGYEALLLGKRVFLYGNVFYEVHSNVVKVLEPSKLHQILTHWLAKPVSVTRDYTQRFVEAYYMASYPGTLDPAGPSADSLARSLYPRIRDAIYKSRNPSVATDRP